MSGTITVGKKMKIIGNSKLLLTLKKNSFIGTICQDGKSQNLLVPDSDCNIDMCSVEGEICSALEKPGVHTLGELEGQV